MINKRFSICDLGEFEYIVTLLSIDYPETFVARRIGPGCELFIFDEIKNDEQSISWICCAITIDEFDGLNKGTRSLNSCFMGPRKTEKQGYLVKSQAGKDIADCVPINDISKYVSEYDVFVPQFVEDNHGSNILSLATGKELVSIVIEENRYADPFINTTQLSNNTATGKAFLRSLPYNIEIKNSGVCIQSNQSIVLNFEISDKIVVSKSSKQATIEQIDRYVDNAESIAALKAIKKALTCNGNSADLLSAFGNNEKTIQKFSKFVSSISKNKTNRQIVQMVDTHNRNIEQIEINTAFAKTISTCADESIKIVNTQERIKNSLTRTGYFEMFDFKGKGKFRFISDEGIIYRGTTSGKFDINICPIEIQGSNIKYLIKMDSFSYKIGEMNTDCTYELVSVKKESRVLQETLKL